MNEYKRPELKLVGSLRDVTQKTHTGIYCDKMTCTLGSHESVAGTGQATS